MGRSLERGVGCELLALMGEGVRQAGDSWRASAGVRADGRRISGEAPGMRKRPGAVGLLALSCSPNWTRTSNPSINSRMLCQLSYGGICRCGLFLATRHNYIYPLREQQIAWQWAVLWGGLGSWGGSCRERKLPTGVCTGRELVRGASGARTHDQRIMSPRL